VLETGKEQLEVSWLEQPRLCSVWEHRTVRCPVRQASSCELAALGISSAVYGYNSPDCPVCTGLSGEPTIGRANGRLRDPRETRGRANGREGAPDCPVCTGLSGAPTAPRRQRSTTPQKETNLHRTVSGVHRTVRCARRQKARFAFPDCSQQLLAALGL
jgi:hypothetical protein